MMNPLRHSRRTFLKNTVKCVTAFAVPATLALSVRDSRPNEMKSAFPQTVESMGLYNIRISREQALEDLDILEYLLNTAYSGIEMARKRGVIFTGCIDKVRAAIRSADSVNTVEFFQAIVETLEEIRDFHLVFSLSSFDRRHVFCKHRYACFADVIVGDLQKDRRCTVLFSSHPGLNRGVSIRPPEDSLFPTLPDIHGERFLIGKMSDGIVEKIPIEVEKKTIDLPVHRCRMGETGTENALWSACRIGDVELVRCHRLTSFSDNEHMRLRALADYGKTLRVARTIVLDLRDNSGGDSSIAAEFIRNLNDFGESHLRYRKLDSLPSRLSELTMRGLSGQAFSAQREACLRDDRTAWREGPAIGKQKGSYKGRLILLTNAQTASSAEIFVKICRESVSDCTVIGENTKGCLNTGDTRYFFLPHALIFINIPTAEFVDVFEEGVGFLPDLWLDGNEPVSAIMEWISQKI